MWLYRLTNKINGKAYIGTSVNPISHRVSRHLYSAKRGRKDMAISCAIRKHGLESFIVESIGETSDYEELMKMEAAAIEAQSTMAPKGYNISAGGRGARRACSQETKALISAKTKGRIPWNFGKRSPSTLKRLAGVGHLHGGPTKGFKPWNFGKKLGPLSDAHKLSIGESVRQIRATRFWSGNKKIKLGGE